MLGRLRMWRRLMHGGEHLENLLVVGLDWMMCCILVTLVCMDCSIDDSLDSKALILSWGWGVGGPCMNTDVLTDEISDDAPVL